MKKFRVEGTGEFPWDMLHEDTCWPATTEAVSAMLDHERRRVVELVSADEKMPTQRWRVFLWRVLPEEVAEKPEPWPSDLGCPAVGEKDCDAFGGKRHFVSGWCAPAEQQEAWEREHPSR